MDAPLGAGTLGEARAQGVSGQEKLGGIAITTRQATLDRNEADRARGISTAISLAGAPRLAQVRNHTPRAKVGRVRGAPIDRGEVAAPGTLSA